MSLFDNSDKSIALVVDDNPDSLGMVASALETQGMTVLVARDGRAAINLTHRVQPDVILMDAVMPELDGFETCKLLKSGPNPTLAPIIFMTGLKERENVVKGLQAGGVDYLTKPVQIDEMLARMTTHVVNSRLLQSARQAIDAFDRAVLAFDRQANLTWGSEKGMAVINGGPIDLSDQLLKAWLLSCASRPVSECDPFTSDTVDFLFIGVSIAGEILVKTVAQHGMSNEDILQQAFNLTQRESEVLYWLTLGKTNRDISTILALSARTVNKHLEQVFQKMGVDNRTSAALMADRKINELGK
ncbi:MAG: DNA-binding response regulator [Pseudomonadota bacterium]